MLILSFTRGKDDSNKKRTSKNTSPSCIADNSLEISNIFTPRDFELAIKMMKLIVENENKYIF